jgi:hypothetical protein
MDKYEPVRDIGSGNFGVARLMRNRETRGLVAVKLIERGHRVCALPSLLFRLQGFGLGSFAEGSDPAGGSGFVVLIGWAFFFPLAD